MERKIGEIFEFNGVKLMCLQGKNIIPSCKGCYFLGKEEHQCLQQLCANYEREDANNVYFKEIKN